VDIIPFGEKLIISEDLDPLYIILHRWQVGRPKLCQWLLAYWCYYNAGLCCWVVDQRDYWNAVEQVALGGKEYPRGTERRHFRGEIAVKSIEQLRERGEAIDIVTWLASAGPLAANIMNRVTTLYGFGQWIKWKIPDMLDRLQLFPVQFFDSDLRHMFKSSLDGANQSFKQYGLVGEPLQAAHDYLIDSLGKLTAPPLHDRLINVQETETIFCKWKSHLHGHYPIGKDTKEVRHSLLRYAKTKTAQELLKL